MSRELVCMCCVSRELVCMCGVYRGCMIRECESLLSIINVFHAHGPTKIRVILAVVSSDMARELGRKRSIQNVQNSDLHARAAQIQIQIQIQNILVTQVKPATSC